MDLIHASDAMSAWTRDRRKTGHTVALVPTMGALHPGHLNLVEAASREADRVVVSIFVNPTQFGEGEDYDAYPRTLDADVAALRAQGLAHAVFAPTVEDMYPIRPNRTWVAVDGLDEWLCGRSRPGHFRGVTTVVSRLFARVEPDVAVFGMKDAQQFFILRRMTADFGFPVRLVGVPTVRAADGLALSSRNAYLTTVERADAPRLFRSLTAAKKALEAGERRPDRLDASVRDVLGDVDIDYVSIVDTEHLQPLEALVSGQEIMVALAVRFGAARLIDNVVVEVP
ncbi:MAG: pantoate--beta-alanine ligase [Rhodothermales bacterium]